VADVFACVAGEMDAHAEIVGQCVAGLDSLLTAARRLRKAYLINRVKVRKLEQLAKLDLGEKTDD